jgi:hypothetical protein
MALACKGEWGKYEDAYNDWEVKDDYADNLAIGYGAACVAAGITCGLSAGAGCVAALAGLVGLANALNKAEKEAALAAGKANGAFASYLVCAVQHKNYYKGTITD